MDRKRWVTRFAWEPLAQVLAEPNAADMIRSYVEELSPLRDILPVAPDWEMKRRMEAEGIYRLWAARVDSTLAGYISFQIVPHTDYKDVKFAFDAGHYLSPAFRDKPGRLGFRMWRTGTAALRELGVQFVMSHDNACRPLMPFMIGLGFEPLGGVYLKRL